VTTTKLVQIMGLGSTKPRNAMRGWAGVNKVQGGLFFGMLPRVFASSPYLFLRFGIAGLMFLIFNTV